VLSRAPGEEVRVVEGKPLAEAVIIIGDRTGVPITYEDPPYLYPGDTMSSPHGIVPRVGPLEFTYAPDLPVLEVLHLAIQAAAQRGYPGVFDVKAGEGYYHVVPVRARDLRGELVTAPSVLDTPIALPTGKTTRDAVLRAICTEVGKSTGKKLLPGMRSPNRFLRDHVWHDPKRRPAREHLIRLLDDLGGGMTWLLFYDATGHRYYLNSKPIGPGK
jgi:hypothetical protein